MICLRAHSIVVGGGRDPQALVQSISHHLYMQSEVGVVMCFGPKGTDQVTTFSLLSRTTVCMQVLLNR